MIILVDGVPGSGKTFYCVNHLVDKYKDKLSEVAITTNIDSLIIPHVDLQSLIDRHGLEKTFNVDFWKQKIKDDGGKQQILIVDECQRYFHKKYFENSVFFFFQYHRHLGLDIYLLTQSEKLIPLQISSMCEFVIHSQPRSISILGEMKYVKKVSGEAVDRIVLKPKQEIFDLYRSMEKQEGEKPKSVFKKFLYLFILAGIACPVVFWYTFLYHPKKAQAEQQKEVKQAQGRAVSPAQVKPVKEEVDKSNPYICGTVILHGKLYIEEPFTNTMIESSVFPYPFKASKGERNIRVVAYLPASITAQLDKRAKIAENVSSAQIYGPKVSP